MSALACQRNLFDIPDGVTFLNSAYLSPLPRPVLEAGLAGVARKNRPWEIRAPDFFSDTARLRGLFARLIGGRPEEVALVPSTSYGLAIAAKNLPLAAGQRVLTVAEQYPSNVYPWVEAAGEAEASVVSVERPDDDDGGDWTAALVEAIDERVAVVAIPGAHWSDGWRLDLERIGPACRAAGAALVVDLTQSLGCEPFALDAVRPDFLIAAGYKSLLGPYSLSYLWVDPRHHDGRPIEFNWINRERSEEFARLVDYRSTYRPGAVRYDVGENSNFALVPMAIAALELIEEWGVESITAALSALTERLIEGAGKLGMTAPPEEARSPHIVGLRLPGEPPAGLVARLEEEQIYVSLRGSSLRVSPHVYNDDADIDRLLAALAEAL